MLEKAKVAFVEHDLASVPQPNLQNFAGTFTAWKYPAWRLVGKHESYCRMFSLNAAPTLCTACVDGNI